MTPERYKRELEKKRRARLRAMAEAALKSSTGDLASTLGGGSCGHSRTPCLSDDDALESSDATAGGKAFDLPSPPSRSEFRAAMQQRQAKDAAATEPPSPDRPRHLSHPGEGPVGLRLQKAAPPPVEQATAALRQGGEASSRGREGEQGEGGVPRRRSRTPPPRLEDLGVEVEPALPSAVEVVTPHAQGPLFCESDHIGLIKKPQTKAVSTPDRQNDGSGNGGGGGSSGGGSGGIGASDYGSSGGGVEGSDEEGEEVFIADWSRLLGETSDAYALRLYQANLNTTATHEENCNLVLRQILERVAHFELAQGGAAAAPALGGGRPRLRMLHQIKLETFLRGTALAMPARTWRQTVQGIISPRGVAGGRVPGAPQPQMATEELSFRLGYFVKTFQELAKGPEGNDLLTDPLRCEGLLRAWTACAGEYLPLQRPARALLPPLLFCMACDILGVRLLGPEVRTVVDKIVADYEARARVWMAPAQNAATFLRPLVLEFASWLRQNAEILYHASATEALLRCVDRDLRFRLKNQVYQSAEHFLLVFQSLRPLLTDIELPINALDDEEDDSEFDVGQTMKDINRERFVVNGDDMSPAQCVEALRSIVTAALTDAAGGPAAPRKPPSLAVTTPLSRALPGMSAVPETRDGSMHVPAELDSPRRRPASPRGPRRPSDRGMHVVQLCQIASDSECDSSSESEPESTHRARATSVPGSPLIGSNAPNSSSISSTAQTGGFNVEGLAERAYVGRCVWRALHAASRTASGGDSFFIVQDLFGGEGVLIKATRIAPPPIRLAASGLTLTVTTTNAYDIYHFSDVAEGDDGPPCPLMTVCTTLKEVIAFLPFRATAYLAGAPQQQQRTAAPPALAATWGAGGSNYHQGPRAAAAAAAAAAATTALTPRAPVRHYEQRGRFLTITADLPAFDAADSAGGSADSSAHALPRSGGDVPALVEVGDDVHSNFNSNLNLDASGTPHSVGSAASLLLLDDPLNLVERLGGSPGGSGHGSPCSVGGGGSVASLGSGSAALSRARAAAVRGRRASAFVAPPMPAEGREGNNSGDSLEHCFDKEEREARAIAAQAKAAHAALMRDFACAEEEDEDGVVSL